MRRSVSPPHFLRAGGIAALLALFATGCTSTPVPCSPSAIALGEFCYAGIDFGRVDDPLRRRGIRDGCRTGRGFFTKEYRLSGSSRAYREGWVRGRTLCRPEHWSDGPTTSYHPLPGGENAHSTRNERTQSRGLSARERMLRYAESESRSDGNSPSPSEPEPLETIRYP
jgi:hypothetical protein